MIARTIRVRRLLCGMLLPIALLAFDVRAQDRQQPVSRSSRPQQQFTLGQVLNAALVPRKHRSLIQRESQFLDIEKSRKHLQIALLLDGTESMDLEIESIRKHMKQFVAGLQEQKRLDGSRFSFALIVYRDEKSPSGPVSARIGKFTEDFAKLEQELNDLQTESGEPYLEERIDLGLYSALANLNWAPRGQDEDHDRWILLCGDAPPYPEFAAKHSTESLATLAKQKGVEIYTVLSSSGYLNPAVSEEKVRQISVEARPDAAKYFEAISSATGGKFLDLWDPEVVNVLRSVERNRPVVSVQMDVVTREDLTRYLASLQGSSETGPAGALALAVMPTLELPPSQQQAFRQPELFATELRERFRALPGLEVLQGNVVDQRLASYQSNGELTDEKIRSLGSALGVNYLVWGKIEEQGDDLRFQIRLSNTQDGTLLAESTEKLPRNDLTGLGRVIPKVCRHICEQTEAALSRRGQSMQNVAVFSTPRTYDEVAEQIDVPYSNDYRAKSAIVDALTCLEKCVSVIKSEEAEFTEKLLNRAIQQLQIASQLDSENPFVYLLLTNAYWNLAEFGSFNENSVLAVEHLERAQRSAETLDEADPLRIEIEALYHLLVRTEPQQAIELYRRLADPADLGNAKFALRANWMLAGILSGDWNVKDSHPDLINPVVAREHVIRVMALWPNSTQAMFFQKSFAPSQEGDGELVKVDLYSKIQH